MFPVLHLPKLLDRGCGLGVGDVAVHDTMTPCFELEFNLRVAQGPSCSSRWDLSPLMGPLS